MAPRNLDWRCKGMAKNGKPCRAAATEGGLCFFHANPNKAVELGRIGRKKNGHLQVGMDPLPGLDNAMAIRDTVARLISDVYAGKLHLRIAAGLASLMHLQLRVLERTEIEKRLGKLERLRREEIMENRKGSAAEEMPEKKAGDFSIPNFPKPPRNGTSRSMPEVYTHRVRSFRKGELQ